MPEDEPTPEELLDIEAADAYLDALGNKRDFEGDQLGATQWRKDVDAEPLDMNRLPSAHTTRGRMPPTTGGTPRMAINEDAAQLGQMAQDETVQGMIGAAKGHIADAIAALAGAQQHAEQAGAQAGSLLGGSEGEVLNSQGQQVAQEISNLIGQLSSADGAADDVNGYANAFLTAVRDSASKHGGGS